MEDKKLMKQLKKGDETALSLIIERYSAYVSAVIGNQLGGFSDVETIEELASDAFFELWQSRKCIKTHHIRGWLGTVARNKARTYLRKKHIQYDTLDESYMLTVEDNSFSSLTAKEQSGMIETALTQVSDAEREVLVRYYYYNQTVTQISTESGINTETVKSRLRRGRLKLKSMLGGYYNED